MDPHGEGLSWSREEGRGQLKVCDSALHFAYARALDTRDTTVDAAGGKVEV